MKSPFPEVPIYLFAGNQVDAILRARDEVLDMLLDRETRAENLTEFSPTSNKFGLELAKLLPEIAADLSTMSFIPGAQKVAVVSNPVELYGSAGRSAPRKKKKKASARKTKAPKATPKRDPLDWIAEGLPATGNHIILLAFEDEAAGREVNDRHPLVQTIGRVGHFQFFRDKKAFWRIEDALLRRDASGCLEAVRDLWKPGKGDQTVYSAIVRSMRFMLQAKIARERGAMNDEAKQALYFPSRSQFSLMKASEFVRKKYVNRPIPYRTPALIEAYEGMLGVYKALRPRPGDLYVPDAQAMLERTLVKLFESEPPRG